MRGALRVVIILAAMIAGGFAALVAGETLWAHAGAVSAAEATRREIVLILYLVPGSAILSGVIAGLLTRKAGSRAKPPSRR